MGGIGSNPITFGMKSTPFGVWFVNPWQASVPASLLQRNLRKAGRGKMTKITSMAVLCFCLITGPAFAENLSGTYVLSSQGATLTLTLEQNAQGDIKGTLSSTTGAQFRVEGVTQNSVGVGTCLGNQGGSYFEAHSKGNELLFALIEPDPNNRPDYSKVKRLTFKRKEEATAGKQGEQLQARPSTPPGMGGLASLSQDEVSDPDWGFRFSLPKGWKVEKGPKGAILGHDTIPGMILVSPHMASSFQEVQMQMQMGLAEEEVQLQLASQLQSLGNNVIAGIYSGIYQRQQVKARGIGTFSPNGGGAYIVAMTLPDKFGPDLANAADAVAKSIQYFKAQGSAGTGGTPGAAVPPGSSNQQLIRQMAGVYYSFSSAGPSYSGGTERQVTLCPNGTYYSGSESGYSAGAGTGGAWGSASQKSGRGTWRVQGNTNQGILTTIDSNGKATEYRYQRCGGDCIYFGNTKFAIAGPANCP